MPQRVSTSLATQRNPRLDPTGQAYFTGSPGMLVLVRAKPSALRLEKGMGIGRVFGDVLDHVPVLDSLASIEQEDIHDRSAPRSGLPHAMGVHDHIVPFSA
jgi:hypothetical protein